MLISSNNHNELYMQTRIVTENYVAYMWFLTIYISLDFHKVWNTPEDL